MYFFSYKNNPIVLHWGCFDLNNSYLFCYSYYSILAVRLRGTMTDNQYTIRTKKHLLAKKNQTI